jgi:hypothetical protein
MTHQDGVRLDVLQHQALHRDNSSSSSSKH